MTQIISLLTNEAVYMSSDRMVTFINENDEVTFRDNNTCKLVNYCNRAGIGFSGIAEVDGQATNEWIATTISDSGCRSLPEVARTLRDKGTAALRLIRPEFRKIEILMTGWSTFGQSNDLVPFLAKISNCLDELERTLPAAKDQLEIRLHPLPSESKFMFTEAGLELTDERRIRLQMDLRELLQNDATRSEWQMTLVREIMRTSVTQETQTVGSSILSMCIPKPIQNNGPHPSPSLYLASEPNESGPTFHYFENGNSEMVQYGPTFVCGSMAVTDVETSSDPSRNFQSSQVRILRVPRSSNLQSE